MALESVSLARNLSRMELAVSIAIIAVLLALFLDRMNDVEAAAEKAVLRARYQDMQSRLMTYRTELLLQERRARPLSLDDFVRHIGRGEVGFFATPAAVDWQAVPPGGWVYVRSTRQLEYRVLNPAYFEVAPGVPARVRFQLEPSYADTNGNGRYDEPAEPLQGVALRLLDTQALAAGPAPP